VVKKTKRVMNHAIMKGFERKGRIPPQKGDLQERF
jgi:hypothetical protein